MRSIRFIPGAVVSPNIITIPVGAPDIGSVVAAQITRMLDTLTIAHGGSATAIAHADGAVVAHAALAVDPHAVHTHDLDTLGTGIAPVIKLGIDNVIPTQIEDSGAAAIHTWAGGGATGVQESTLDAHVVTQPQDHTPGEVIAGLADHGGANVALALIDHLAAGVTPEVGATATILSTRTISLSVDTELGDLLSFSYHEVGDAVLTS